MPKVPTFKSLYIPKDVYFLDDAGKLKRNSEFPDNEIVKCELSYSDVEQKNAYMQFYYRQSGKKSESMEMHQQYSYNACLRKHVKRIDNLIGDDGKPIHDGASLVLCNNPGLNDLKIDLFQKINGIKIDDEDETTGELSLGEEKASS